MSRELRTLRDHAGTQAALDPDKTARPVWAQIRDDIDAYLGRVDEPGPAAYDQPLFPETSTP